MFADRATIYVRSGKGGDGHVSFRREKYVPNGGPDGGDGGNGGSVILKVDNGVNTLADYRHVRKYKAGDGEEGKKKNCRGKNGEDIVLKLPMGTVVKEAETDKVIVDMSGDTTEFVLLTGGKGGNGNQHYATSTMQAPKYAQPGQPAKELTLKLELKVIADVGLVGFPNVGKSTFLTKISNARPEIANYHFTTLSPHLGVVDLKDAAGYVVADIPGLIEGAADGVGLGHEFLRHIERTKVIIHIVDAAGSEGRDPIEDIYAINKELALYNEELTKRPQIIAANKLDLLYEGAEISRDEMLNKLKAEFEPKGYKVFPMSALTGEGVKEILYAVRQMLDNLDDKPVIFEAEYDPNDVLNLASEPFTVEYDAEEDEYVVEGPRIEKMLGYTNLESEKGFVFFQKFMKENDILTKLEELGCNEGDTVRMYGLKFDYYK
ncbi:MAG: GTPase ObgE [Lachnospiraceae bacterium]|nr:GTPase ObgE [Lachnospiraceae bacterium]